MVTFSGRSAPASLAAGVLAATLAVGSACAPAGAAPLPPDPGVAGPPGQSSPALEATRLRHVHGSSHWASDPGPVEADLDRWMERADVVTMTEATATPERRATLEETGWSATSDSGSSDAAIMWRDSAWTAVRTASVRVTDQGFADPNTGAAQAASGAVTALLRNRHSGATVLLSVIHLPSLVESPDGSGFDPAPGLRDRVAAYDDAVRGLRDHVADWTATHEPTRRLVVADWNIDAKRSWARDYLERAWAGTGLAAAWRAPYPAGGTFVDVREGYERQRIIDGTLVDAEAAFVRRPQVMGPVASSDHRPYREVLHLPARPEPPSSRSPTRTTRGPSLGWSL